jgi:predicted RNase H-like HicB family nuclease
MLTQYIESAMRKARYKLLTDGEGIFGQIPGFKGLWASAKTLEDCRDELQSVLEDWLLVKLRHNDGDLPKVGGIDLNLPGRKKSKVA